MKKVLFASSALAALAIGGAASAQGISLFGTARLGLGYGINNDGTVRTDDDGGPSDELRAVSRVRFGVNMTGETNSGITFGATIRADNAINGNAALRILKQAVTVDPDERKAIIEDIQAKVGADLSTLPLLQGAQVAVAGTDIDGVILDASFKFRFAPLTK